MDLELLDQLREQNPIGFNLSNFVTVQDVANGINALGASPIMSEEIRETEAMVNIASSVTINLGAFNEPQVNHAKEVLKWANQLNKPVVIDPVAVGAVAFRKQVCNELLDQYDVEVIRGNAGEIAALADVEWNAKGIDAGEGDGDLVAIAKALANKRHCVVALSGPTDIITDGEHVTQVHNGTNLFQLHVGSGDMLSSVIGAFCGVTNNYYEASQVACATFAVCGEVVAKSMNRELAGSFGPQLIDELHLIDVDTVANNVNYN